MATKNNIRSIRFTDELADLIDRQQGKNFQQKFENLITRCVFELPQREKELKHVEERKARALEQAWELEEKVRTIRSSLNDIQVKAALLSAVFDKSLEKFEIDIS